ncbi:MAG: tail fiber domain-containing protein [Bacteroidota bacterium]
MKKTLLFIVCLTAYTTAWSQGVSVSPSGTPADPSAALDLNYTDKGLLVPRVSLVQTTSPSPILAPATSLLVYNTTSINDVTPGYYFWDGLKWARLMVDNGGGGSGGGNTNVNCSTTFNDGWTIRGDGSGGWECTNTLRVLGNSSTGYVSINTTPSSSFDLLVNNNVGIGFSPSSSYDLSVDGNAEVKDYMGIGATPSSSYTLRVGSNIGVGTSPSSSFNLSVSGDAHVSTGLSVGTTSSASSGQVYANSSFRLGSSSSGTGTAVVRTSGGLLVPQSSTRRVKDNIRDLNIDREKFLQLRPVSFNLKKSLGADADIGLIAEEVEQLVPDLVVYGPKRTWVGNDGEVLKNEQGEEILSSTEVEPYSVRYDKIGVYLIQIVADQQRELELLKARLEKIESK